MTKKAGITFDLGVARSLGIRTAELTGMLPDGEVAIVHYRPLSGDQVLDYLEREEDKEVSQVVKYREACKSLSGSLVTPDGEPLATEEQVRTFPADLINTLMALVAGIKKEEAEKNASTGAAA